MNNLTNSLPIIDKTEINKDSFIIDGKLKYPIRITTHSFKSSKYGYLSYNVGSIMTEFGIIGLYQEDDYTKLDLVTNNQIYTIKFTWILSKDELNDAVKYFINII